MRLNILLQNLRHHLLLNVHLIALEIGQALVELSR